MCALSPAKNSSLCPALGVITHSSANGGGGASCAKTAAGAATDSSTRKPKARDKALLLIGKALE
jgi:hypothetical protein